LAGALANLVVNALDLLGREADVLVEVEAVASPAGLLALVHVADNGPGVSVEAADRVFEPFFTTRQGGTGLGLAIVQSVARALGGSVRLATTPHSATHDGAHFIVELPVIEPSGENHAR
jgi:signal transduction histidine kinase